MGFSLGVAPVGGLPISEGIPKNPEILRPIRLDPHPIEGAPGAPGIFQEGPRNSAGILKVSLPFTDFPSRMGEVFPGHPTLVAPELSLAVGIV